MPNFKVKNCKLDTPLASLVPGDSIYVKKNRSGFQHIILCEFVGIERGIVSAKVVKPEERYLDRLYPVNSILTTRAANCAMYDSRGDRPHFVWFKSLSEVAS